MAAGQLRHRFAFDRRAQVSDGAGAEEGEFAEEFVCAAGITPKFSGESVQSDRLQGKTTITLTVRRTKATLAITADWRARDVRSAPNAKDQLVYAILSGPIDAGDDRKYLEFLCQYGKAA